MGRRLIFLDIDGTLTSPGTNVPPPSALAAIRAAQRAGNRVFLCSGRNYDMLRPLLVYHFDGVVASAGGYILCGDEVIYDCPMTPTQQETMLRLLGEQGVYRTLECRDATFCDPGVADLMMEASGGDSEQKRWRVALEERLGFRPFSEFDGRPVYKLVVMCRTPEQLQPARDALEGEFQFLVRSGGRMGLTGGEIINRQFHKGLGVERVARYYGVPIADTVGFGDSLNDLEMIQTVGVSVCMENGSPELKKYASRTCPRVEEDGLAKAFEELGLLG